MSRNGSTGYAWSSPGVRDGRGFAVVMARSPYYCAPPRRPAKARSQPSANGPGKGTRKLSGAASAGGYDTLPGTVRTLLGGPRPKGGQSAIGIWIKAKGKGTAPRRPPPRI